MILIWTLSPIPVTPILFYDADFMARLEGLEPPPGCLEGSCSIRLSYRRTRSFYSNVPPTQTYFNPLEESNPSPLCLYVIGKTWSNPIFYGRGDRI